jgi:hypothetical protein
MLDASKAIGPQYLPMCEHCQMPVEELALDVALDASGEVVILVARCHGEEEEVRVPIDVWDASETLKLGSAFKAHNNNPTHE